MIPLLEKTKNMMHMDSLDQETIGMIERLVVVRISTKHINLWIRQLEMKRREICELAGLMGLQEVKKEISEEKNLERWARRCSNFFTKNVKRCYSRKSTTWSGVERKKKSPGGATEIRSTTKSPIMRLKKCGTEKPKTMERPSD